jgi:DNA-binding MarR family transcriptional regulator/N-acetylglutamate synthase-like GNAT family acetyltransferase
VQNAPLDTRIAAVRRFNRFYTRQIGLLRKSFLDSSFSLTEARVLYEIGQGEAPTATDIARKLDLDAGYLSRMLRALEKRGLIARVRSKTDARRSNLALTARGRRTFEPIEARSQHDAGAMLANLTNADQMRLVSAMRGIEELLGAEPEDAPAPSCTLRQARPGDFGWMVARHAVLYKQDYGWTEPFEGLCAQIVADFVNNYDAKRERCWIAEIDGENVGCVMLVKDSKDVARLRLLLVEPKARGLGIGERLVDECTRFARKCGYRKITLWTHSVLIAARKIYERAGFKLVSTEKHNSWGKPVVGETWDLEL